MRRLPLITASLAASLLVASPVSTGLTTHDFDSPADEFRLKVVRPVLKGLDKWSCELESLLVATAAHESHLGRLSKNVFQITEIAADELRRTTPDRFDEPANRWHTFTQVSAAATIYLRSIRHTGGGVKETIPATSREAAFLWKRVYNTPAGKGTVRKFIRDAEREGVKWCRQQ